MIRWEILPVRGAPGDMITSSLLTRPALPHVAGNGRRSARPARQNEVRDEKGWQCRYQRSGGAPSSLACIAVLRSPRPLTPNLRNRADTCTETVFGLMNNAV